MCTAKPVLTALKSNDRAQDIFKYFPTLTALLTFRSLCKQAQIFLPRLSASLPIIEVYIKLTEYSALEIAFKVISNLNSLGHFLGI